MPYKRMKKNKVEWVADVMRQGKRYFGIFETRAKALDWESEKRNAPEEELTTPTVSLTLIEWATKYLEYAEVRFVKKTFKEKKAMFKTFFKTVDSSMPVENLRPVQVLNYLRAQAKKRSGYAANKERKNLIAGWTGASSI